MLLTALPPLLRHEPALVEVLGRASATLSVPEAARAQEEEEWRTIGLMRVRDMTPFGLNRLDMLPAHAAVLPTGSFAFELNLTYQNTWALSRNVDRYLEERGTKREEIGPAEVAAILALPGEAYLVDGEYGLADLTFHYRFSEHLGAYATIPWYDFENGFLDAAIEGFHTGIGISNAGRDYVPRILANKLANEELFKAFAPKNPRIAAALPRFHRRCGRLRRGPVCHTFPGSWPLA